MNMFFSLSLSVLYFVAKEVRFAAERNPTDEECWHYIYNKMPQKVQSSKVLQKLYIRYYKCIISGT